MTPSTDLDAEGQTTHATWLPKRPSARIPRLLPVRSIPSVCCHPRRWRIARDSCTSDRTKAKISDQVSSAVTVELPSVPVTTTPCRWAASISMAALRMSVVTNSFRRGSLSKRAGVKRGALAHQHHNVCVAYRSRQRPWLSEMLGVRFHRHRLSERTPVGQGQGHLLIIV